MPSLPVAVAVVEENVNVILSEAGRQLTREDIHKWIAEHEDGYFVRHERHSFDCKLISTFVFEQIYRFKHNPDDSLFREVELIPPEGI